jgi:cell division protein FtsB
MGISTKTIYIILSILLLIFLLGNEGARKVMRRYWEFYKLKGEISQLKHENALLNKEVYLLENNQSYIEQAARRELGLIAPGEVEYRFGKKKEEK